MVYGKSVKSAQVVRVVGVFLLASVFYWYFTGQLTGTAVWMVSVSVLVWNGLYIVKDLLDSEEKIPTTDMRVARWTKDW